ncbi:hypothetical protein Dcar01_02665 [Deinococcus carri]|uniref:Diguanylate cyclase n=1 Tax=Deinococcus carri TaxID=1211323 RepID=A0ABP9W989_9DEIO
MNVLPYFRQPLFATLLVLAGLHLLWTLTGAHPQTLRVYLGNLIFFPIYALSALLAWQAARQHRGPFRRAWLWLGLGIFAWGAGQIIYTWLSFTGNRSLFPSLADVGYLALVPCFFIGLLHFPRPHFGRVQSVSFLLDISIVVLALGDLLWNLNIRQKVQTYAGQPFPLGVALAYPLTDLLLCTLLLMLLLWRPPQLSRLQTRWLMAGLLLFLLVNLLYAYQTGQGLYVLGRPLDTLWSWGAVCFGAAATAARPDLIRARPRPITEMAYPEMRRLLLPNAAIITTYALFFLVHSLHLGADGDLDPIVGLVTSLVLVRQVLGLVDNQALHRRLAHQASRDPLTGLLNRGALDVALRHALTTARASHLTAVLFIDLDRMKLINDSAGHAAGDQVLQEAADRLQRGVGFRGQVARAGGDEFVVILPDLPDAAAAGSVAAALLTAIAEPMLAGGQEQHLTASIGVALAPLDTADPVVALKCADMAMYQAKKQGKNTWRFYDERCHQTATEELQLDAQLRVALTRGEFEVHYQPLVRLGDERVLGFEALLRWLSPVLGPVPPLKFIPVAEEHGLIHDLGAWVLQEALGQVKRWRDGAFPELHVSVNVSAHQFAREDFVGAIREALRAHALPGNALMLELTESALITDLHGSVAKLRELHGLGVRFALDDFGTGYSSLSYLQQLPVQVLKIDRSFVRDMDSTGVPLLQALITMAHALDLTVIAEGVETPGQLDVLRGLHCDLGQGYLFGHPQPADVAGAALEQESSGTPLARLGQPASPLPSVTDLHDAREGERDRQT